MCHSRSVPVFPILHAYTGTSTGTLTATVPLPQIVTEELSGRVTEENRGGLHPYATDPPVIVDSNGRYYGRLTLNRYHSEIGIGRQYMGWLAAVCQN
jgi:hypothetical protein